ncbi:hypothetical protein ACIHDR_25115 [Nocardia sp. NPDC052278]
MTVRSEEPKDRNRLQPRDYTLWAIERLTQTVVDLDSLNALAVS